MSIGEEGFISTEDLLANVTECYQCKELIYTDDDEAHVCIECGGRNRRWPDRGNANE